MNNNVKFNYKGYTIRIYKYKQDTRYGAIVNESKYLKVKGFLSIERALDAAYKLCDELIIAKEKEETYDLIFNDINDGVPEKEEYFIESFSKVFSQIISGRINDKVIEKICQKLNDVEYYNYRIDMLWFALERIGFGLGNDFYSDVCCEMSNIAKDVLKELNPNIEELDSVKKYAKMTNSSVDEIIENVYNDILCNYEYNSPDLFIDDIVPLEMIYKEYCNSQNKSSLEFEKLIEKIKSFK